MANMYPSKKASGSTPTETVLWTNPDTSAAFDTQTVNLSDSYLNYDYIKVYFDGNDNNAITIAKDDMTYMKSWHGSSATFPAVYYENTLDAMFVRRFYCSANNKMYFSTASAVGGSGSNTSRLKPYKVTGIK